MEMIKAVIVDDDLGALLLLEKYLSRLKEFEIIATFTDPIEAISEIPSLEFDLLFLDVEMPQLTGIELIKVLSRKRNIILTTSSKNYAIEGFELDVLDYLLKPVAFGRLIKAVNKFKDRTGVNTVPKGNAPLKKKSPKGVSIYVKENYKNVKINLNDILYIESSKEYVNIVTTERNIKTKQRLSFFENSLEQHDFSRIHRSFIVSLNSITAYTNSEIEIGGRSLPVGRNYKKTVGNLLANLN